MGQNRLRDEVLVLGQHGSRPSKRPARRPASVAVCFSCLLVLGSREADPFREATAPRKGNISPECTCNCNCNRNCT